MESNRAVATTPLPSEMVTAMLAGCPSTVSPANPPVGRHAPSSVTVGCDPVQIG